MDRQRNSPHPAGTKPEVKYGEVPDPEDPLSDYCQCCDGPHTFKLERLCSKCNRARCMECLETPQPSYHASVGFYHGPSSQSKVIPRGGETVQDMSHSKSISNLLAIPPRSEEPVFSGPDLFAKCPKAYFNDVSSLQERIFESGKHAMPYVSDNEGWESSEVLRVQKPPAGLLPAGEARFLLLKTLKLLRCTTEGHQFLRDCGFYDATYNLIISDRSRPQVFEVVPISVDSLVLISSLLEEGLQILDIPSEGHGAQGTAFLAHKSLIAILWDIQETINCILPGLFVENPFTHTTFNPSSAFLPQRCYGLYSAQIVLFLGLVSFVSAHLPDATSQNECPGLCIETMGNDIYLELRKLRCLESFTTQPVWTFSRSHATYGSPETPPTHYISIYPADFKDLWGPITLQYAKESSTRVFRIITRGGMIHATPPESQPISVRQNEVLCHFQCWMENDNKSDKSVLTLLDFSRKEKLLIGTPQSPFSQSNDLPITPPLNSCTCRLKQGTGQNPFSQVFELQARPPFWEIDERVAQCNVGMYVNIVYGQTWKFNAGWSLKDVIVHNWAPDISNYSSSTHVPCPSYIDFFTVLEISYCSANAQRTSLWDLLKRREIEQFLTSERYGSVEDLKILLNYFPQHASFEDVWSGVTDEGRSTLRVAIQALLDILKSTGVRKDGVLQAWDLTAPNRRDGRKYTSNWIPMVKDDTDCATFAVITGTCLKMASFEPKRLLNTRMCLTIVTNGSTLKFGTHPVQILSQLPENSSNSRPTWSLSPENFDRWKVRRSEAQSSDNASDDSRIRKLNCSRDDAAGLSMISDIVAKRQAQRRNMLGKPRPTCSDEQKVTKKHDRYRGQAKPVQREIDRHERRITSFRYMSGEGQDIGRLHLKRCETSLGGFLALSSFRDILEEIALNIEFCPTYTLAEWQNKGVGPFGWRAKIRAKEATLYEKYAAIARGGNLPRERVRIVPWAVSKAFRSLGTPEALEPCAKEYVRRQKLESSQVVIRMGIF